MEWLTVTLEIYRRSARRAAELALRNWPVLGSLFAYGAILLAATYFALPFGPAGGLLLGLVLATCTGSFLYLVEMMVRSSKVTWEDFRRSFGAYLWDVMGVNFVLWGFSLVSPMIAALPNGTLILLCISILAFVFFNAVPELIYLGHHSVFELFSESYRFITENWIEWFPPNILLFVAYLGLQLMPAEALWVFVAKNAAIGLFIYFAMVTRGLLFLELHGTSRRARAFRHRARG